MLAVDANPKTVSEAMGHASPAFTLQRYSHLLPGIQKAAMGRLGEMLSPAMGENKNVGRMSASDGASERI
jgi:hypothetical protein